MCLLSLHASIKRSTALVFLIFSASFALAAPPIPGAILAGGFDSNEIRQYSPAGVLLDQYEVTGVPDNIAGIKMLGGVLYALDVAGNLGSINTTTGEFSLIASTGVFGYEDLGRMGDDLLFSNFIDRTIERRTITGALVSTIPIGVRATGVDSDGTSIFVADIDTGDIRTFSSSGVLQSSFSFGVGGDTLSALAYNPATDTLFVGASFGDPGQAREYTRSGVLLSTFEVPFRKANGLSFFDGAAVAAPEPGSLALVAVGIVTVTVAVCRRGKARLS